MSNALGDCPREDVEVFISQIHKRENNVETVYKQFNPQMLYFNLKKN